MDKPKWYSVLYYHLYGVYHWRVAPSVCRLRGHKYTADGSYATKDGGAEHHTCSRCGYSWSVTYY